MEQGRTAKLQGRSLVERFRTKLAHADAGEWVGKMDLESPLHNAACQTRFLACCEPALAHGEFQPLLLGATWNHCSAASAHKIRKVKSQLIQRYAESVETHPRNLLMAPQAPACKCFAAWPNQSQCTPSSAGALPAAAEVAHVPVEDIELMQSEKVFPTNDTKLGYH